MKNDITPSPQPLSREPDTAAGALLDIASRWEPPADAQENIWLRITEPHRRLADQPGESFILRDILSTASGFEPPRGAQERIWRQLTEELSARAGLNEPRRLAETGDFVSGLLSEASNFEPPPGKQARVFRALRRPSRTRWLVPVTGLAAAAAVFALFILPSRETTPIASPVTAPALALSLPESSGLKVTHSTSNTGPNQFAVGDRLEVAQAESVRFQLSGVGDIVLQDQGTSLSLTQVDERGVRVSLAQGRISLHAQKRPRNAPLIIQAQGAEVEVVGTIFSVEASSQGPRVFVKEGLVEVRSRGQVARIGAGQTWPSTEPMSSWASEAMNTLAGEQQASLVLPSLVPTPDPVAPAKKDRIKQPRVQTPETKAPTSINSGHEDLPSLLPAEPVEPPKPVLPPVETPAAPKLRASTTAARSELVNFLEDQNDYFGRSLTYLEEKRAELSKSSETRQLINVLTAIATASDTRVPKETLRAAQGRARVELATTLDSIGALRNAIDVRRKITISGSTEERVEARFANLASFVALNEISEGLRIAEFCEREGGTNQRAMALVMKARLLANKGSTQAAEAAFAAALELDVNAPRRAASYFDEWGKRTPKHAGVFRQIAEELRSMGSAP